MKRHLSTFAEAKYDWEKKEKKKKKKKTIIWKENDRIFNHNRESDRL
jgi:hypothetical protein